MDDHVPLFEIVPDGLKLLVMASQTSRPIVDASDFSDFPLNRAVRHLATRLLEFHGAPRSKITWPLDGAAPLSGAESALVKEVLFDHSLQHHVAFESLAGLPQCLIPASKCKGLGAALALDHAFQQRGPDASSVYTSKLRIAGSGAQSKLRHLVKTIGDGRTIWGKFHEVIWKSRDDGNERLCELPLPIVPAAQRLIDAIDYMNEALIKPLTPTHQQGTYRRGLLVLMEAALHEHGWTYDEIVSAVDDGRGENKFGRKDRLRQRLREYRAKQRAK